MTNKEEQEFLEFVDGQYEKAQELVAGVAWGKEAGLIFSWNNDYTNLSIRNIKDNIIGRSSYGHPVQPANKRRYIEAKQSLFLYKECLQDKSFSLEQIHRPLNMESYMFFRVRGVSREDTRELLLAELLCSVYGIRFQWEMKQKIALCQAYDYEGKPLYKIEYEKWPNIEERRIVEAQLGRNCLDGRALPGRHLDFSLDYT